MPYRRPLVPLLAAAAVTLTLAAGCSSTSSGRSAGPSGTPELSNLTVAAVPTTDSTGLYIAEYEGLFAQQGLHVTIQPAISAEQSISQLAFGQIQVLAGNYVSFIQAQDHFDSTGMRETSADDTNPDTIAADLDLFAEASVMQPGFVGLFVRPGSPIKAITDLKNKTIGINAPNNVAYLLLASFEKANGIPPTPTKLLRYIPFPLMQQKLLSGQIDVAFLAEPFISIAEQTAGVTELTNLDAGANTGFPIEAYAATKQFARKYPRTLAAFNRAIQQGQQVATTNRQVAELATVKYGLLPNLPPHTTTQFANQIAALLQFETYPLGHVDPTRLQRVAEAMQEFSILPSGPRFNVREMIGG